MFFSCFHLKLYFPFSFFFSSEAFKDLLWVWPLSKGAPNISSNINRRVAASQRKWLCVLGLVLKVSSFSMAEQFCFFLLCVGICCSCQYLYLKADDIHRPACTTQQNCILKTPFEPTLGTLGKEICGRMERGERLLLRAFLSFSLYYFFFHFGSDISLCQDHSYLFV